MYENEIYFNNDEYGDKIVRVIKLDDLYRYRPSLYNINSWTVTDMFNVHEDDVDIFDSMFLSNLLSLIIKNVTINTNSLDMTLSIVEYETKINYESVFNLEDYMPYIREIEAEFIKILKQNDVPEVNLSDNVIDVSIMFMDNRNVMMLMMTKD